MHVAAGSVVCQWVHVEVSAQADRHFVAVTDRLPAGFEIVRPKSNRALSRADGVQDFPVGNPSEVYRSRDVIAVPAGRRPRGASFVYAAMAVTPGVFTAPLASAEEMYAPEVFGRTGAATL